ncbi:glucarate dehydratase [Streptomyces sp. TverLS-915]|uniref:glucarate dehydratase family protein n=1 Tax=unclassified Streptomyces TaxID=2593676 RepID=UPI0001B57EEE|nr:MULTISPECIES: glucarate dehydratase family protein [unclassified Streptomyces]EFL02338.1 glucarate dehydratase [Streptomyces sp. SPB78]SCD94286.1 glucarate dehydratase [Streptomyces sp. TverLS-915]
MSAAAARGPRVTEAVVTPIAFPDPPLLNASGVHQPWALRTIVEIRTDEGLYGLGETYGDAAHLALVRRTAAALTGLDVFDLADAYRRTAAALDGAAASDDKHGLIGPATREKTLLQVYSPFEVACLDAQGKALGRPVSDLLGGRFRDEVPFSAYLFYKWAGHPGAAPDSFGEALDADGIVRQARAMTERYGFESIKLKGGTRAPEEEVAAVHALRAAFPTHELRLDPNAAWTVETSLKVATETRGLLEYLEDPAPGIDGMAAVARGADMPLATNMCVVAFEHIAPAFTRNAVQVVLADHHYWGGLRRSLELAAICRTFGVGVSMHSNSHLGISLAAMVHLAGAVPVLDHALDTHTPWQDGTDVVEHPLTFHGGKVSVPTTPGLGVALDRDALARLHENYTRCGITERDDTTYMRRFVPDFTVGRAKW